MLHRLDAKTLESTGNHKFGGKRKKKNIVGMKRKNQNQNQPQMKRKFLGKAVPFPG